ncbi:MAG: EamA family transporter [Burkholderiaceae bacterium]
MTASESRARTRAALAVPLLALLWGLNWVAVRVVLREVAPWTLRATGLGLGAALLFAFALARGDRLRVARGQWPRLVAASLLTIAGFNVLVAFAQLAGTTSRAAILTYTMPIWAIALAWPVLGERPDRRRAIALGLGAAGLALLAAPLLDAPHAGAGAALACGGGLSWAAGTVLAKRLPVDAAPVPMTAWQLAIGALAAGAGMLAFEGVPVPRMLGAPAALALAYHVVLAMALAYFLWFEVIARLPAGTAALGTLGVPVVGVAGAMALLGERPSAADLAGFACVLAAATIALRAGPAVIHARAAGTPADGARDLL